MIWANTPEAAAPPQQQGELMGLVAEGLVSNDFSIGLPDCPEGRRLSIACPPARCTLMVADCGWVEWAWHPASSTIDHRHLADLISTLLTGQVLGPGAGRRWRWRRRTLKARVSQELQARGLRVKLDLYPDEDFDVHAAIVVTAPGIRGEVYLAEDGRYLSWSRDYWAELASATPEPGHAAGGSGLGELAGQIVASVTQAMTMALPGRTCPP
jgi:hypothetical protein